MYHTLSHDRASGLFIGCVFLVLGIMFCVFAANQYFTAEGLARTAQTVKGTVIDFQTPDSCYNPDGCGAAPVVRFVTRTGKTIMFKSNGSSSPSVGESVDVLYDPANPQRAEISGAWNSVILIFAGVGLVFAFLGGLLLIGKL